ncbi:MAG: LptE family protein [Phycisphaerales bacterium]|nr:LptE family protein [Phycisphaerales bacterium]MCB9835303.1 LptE family protein [Phycisphaera sp.]
MTTAMALLRTTLLLFIAATLASCSSDPTKGYSFESAHDSTIRTVAVPIFSNDTFHHGVELTLTEDIIKQIQRQTPWRVTSAENADALLTGSIKGVNLRSLSTRTGSGFVQEMAVQITVDFEFVDNRSGKALTSRTGYSALGSFAPAQPTGERIDVGYAGASQTLARDLVGDLQQVW